jgi:hypothetical protein
MILNKQISNKRLLTPYGLIIFVSIVALTIFSCDFFNLLKPQQLNNLYIENDISREKSTNIHISISHRRNDVYANVTAHCAIKSCNGFCDKCRCGKL